MSRPDPDKQRTPQFTTGKQASFRAGAGRRLLWATAIAVALLLAGIWLGPDPDVVRKRFEIYGAPGEMKIMPQISIDRGADQIHQLPRSLQAPPPARLEVEPDRTDPRAMDRTHVVKNPAAENLDVVHDRPSTDAELDENPRVELLLPQQTSSDYYLLVHVHPVNPMALAGEDDRRRSFITVTVWVFVDPQGKVTAAELMSNDGGPAFAQAAIDAVTQWKFGWRVEEKVGRTLILTHRFFSPYVSARRP